MYSTVIINSVALNGGDAAIMEAVIASVNTAFPQDAGSTIVLDRDAQSSRKYFPDITFGTPGFEIGRGNSEIATFLRSVKLLVQAIICAHFPQWASPRLSPEAKAYFEAMGSSKRVVSTGGTMFVERYSLYPKFFEILIARIFGKDVFLFTQSFEKINKLHNRLMMKFIFSVSKCIMVRGESSRQAVLEIGDYDHKCHVLADCVFRFYRTKPAPQTDRVICISVRPWKHARSENAQERYRQEIVRLCSMITDAYPSKIVFVSTCQGIPEYNLHDDEEAEVIWSMLPEATKMRARVDHGFRRSEDLMDLFSSSELVIATRLHASILALCARAPVIPIAYEHKTHEVFSRVAPNIFVSDYDTIDADAIYAEVKRVKEGRSGLLQELEENLVFECQDSRRADALLTGSPLPS